MEIVGDRKFVEVPGQKTHELPPLLVQTTPKVKRLDRVVGMAGNIIDSEDMLAPPGIDNLTPDLEMDRRKGAVARIIKPFPISPDAAEVAANPRSRSAKLRVIEKTNSKEERI